MSLTNKRFDPLLPLLAGVDLPLFLLLELLLSSFCVCGELLALFLGLLLSDLFLSVPPGGIAAMSGCYDDEEKLVQTKKVLPIAY